MRQRKQGNYVTQVEQNEPQGIGGWLLLVVLGLCISPVRIGLLLYQTHLPFFSDGSWDAVTSPSSEIYHPLWAPLIVFEVVGNLALIAFAMITLYFLLTKSRRTPTIAISWFLAALVFVVADFFFADLIPAIADQPTDYESVKEVARAAIRAAIWVPYFLVSKRVKATFTR